MINAQFVNMVRKLFLLDILTFSLYGIFQTITEGTVVDEDDFIRWFEEESKEMRLIEGTDYAYCCDREIDSIVVRGNVGLAMILRSGNEISTRTRSALETIVGVSPDTFIAYLLKK